MAGAGGPPGSGITKLIGDVIATGPGVASSTVLQINGSAVPPGGSLVTGSILQVSGVSSLSYGPLNLGLAASVTGLLPVGNIVPGTNGYVLTTMTGVATWQPNASAAINQLTGDVTAGPGAGSQASTVIRINGSTVPSGGALVTGTILQVSGVSSLSYGALNLGLAASVTGLLPLVNMTPGGPGQVLTTQLGAVIWSAPATTGITQLSGDVTAGPGTGSQPATVVRINGAAVPVAGALVTGNVLQVTGVSTLSYSPINLAGGANFITGLLPVGNIAPSATNGQVLTTVLGATVWATPASGGITQLTGDVTAGPGSGSVAATVVALDGVDLAYVAFHAGQFLGFDGTNWVNTGIPPLSITAGAPGQILQTNAGGQTVWATVSGDATISSTGITTVARINGATVPVAGALVTGNVLQVNGASSLSYGPINLAGGANFVTGNLPVTNIAPSVTNGQVLTTVLGTTVWATPASGGITQLTGDVTAGPGSGSVAATVVAVNGASVPVSGALVTGNVLQVTGVSTLSYSSINLAGGANFVTGNLPVTNIAPGAVGQVLTTAVTGVLWATPPAAGITQLTGDVTAGPGSGSQPATVVAVNGATVPAAGALVTGNVLQVTGASALSYGPINLAGGPNFVTGNLPVTNIAPGAVGQVLTTAVTGVLWATPAGTTFPLEAPDGSPAAPEYAFAAQTGTGMYRDTASSNLRFAVEGNYAAGFDPNGTLYGFQSASVGPVGVPYILGEGPGSDSTWLFVGTNIASPLSSASSANASMRASSSQTWLNCPTSGLGFALHLQVAGADFIECGGATGAPDQVALGVQGGTNILFGGGIFTVDFGSGQNILASVNSSHPETTSGSVDKDIGYWWTATTTDGSPQGLVFLGTGGTGGLGNGARSSMAPCGLGTHNTQQGDEVCERAYGRTSIGTSNTTTATIPTENGTFNGKVRVTGRLISPGVGVSPGTAGDAYYATFDLRLKTVAGVVTVDYFALDAAGTSGTDASMVGPTVTATASGTAVAIEIDATSIASGGTSIEDWQTDLFKSFIN